MMKGNEVINNIIQWARRKSPWILHFNSGGCNGCDIELLSLLTPKMDVERLGILKESSPRHADILVCTGPVTAQTESRLKRIYQQMPAPKWVIAAGSCGCTGGVFSGAYNIHDGIDNVIPVDVYIPGCPARPEAIVDGVVKLLEKIR